MTLMIVDFQPIGKKSELKTGETLLDAARKAGIGITSICGGMGTCEECKIQLISGTLTSPTPDEKNILGSEAISSGWRLACQSRPITNVKLYIPQESLTTIQRLQIEGTSGSILIDPIPKSREVFGLAVDIGTTKIAAYLVDMNTGEVVAKEGMMNPQIAFGEDVISRITYTESVSGGAAALQEILINSLNNLLSSLCKKGNILPSQVLDTVIVGNTAMHHLAAGLPVKQLGYAPFSPWETSSLSIPAHKLGLKTDMNTQVYFPPVVAGYIGSDHMAMLLVATKFSTTGDNFYRTQNDQPAGRKTKNIIALDIGTNTEISLISDSQIFSCSCASGPAFEGAHISEGMRASSGAIERAIWIDGGIRWQTIDTQPPIGICGSGILDIISALLLGKKIKSTGQFVIGTKYTVVPKGKSGLNRDIIVTRDDIHEIQLAKAAICSGIEILLKKTGKNIADLDAFMLAGAFGTYLNPQSAIKIGMFPPIPRDIIHQIGNAAGVGAIQLLLSKKTRKYVEKLAKEIQYVELATNSDFTNAYIRNMTFSL